MHVEAQDQSAAGWGQVTDLIERLAQTSAPILEPSAQIPWEGWMRVITLPPQVASLTHVVEIRLYGSHLRRLPPRDRANDVAPGVGPPHVLFTALAPLRSHTVREPERQQDEHSRALWE